MGCSCCEPEKVEFWGAIQRRIKDEAALREDLRKKKEFSIYGHYKGCDGKNHPPQDCKKVCRCSWPYEVCNCNKRESVVRTDLEFHNEIIDIKAWSGWSEGDVETVRHDWTDYTVELVKLNASRFQSYYDSYDVVNEPPMGWTGEAYMVFKISYPEGNEKAELFFKKSGTVNSYYGIHWDGKWTRVTPKRKEVVTYEFE